jgi:hypothetical protein
LLGHALSHPRAPWVLRPNSDRDPPVHGPLASIAIPRIPPGAPKPGGRPSKTPRFPKPRQNTCQVPGDWRQPGAARPKGPEGQGREGPRTTQGKEWGGRDRKLYRLRKFLRPKPWPSSPGRRPPNRPEGLAAHKRGLRRVPSKGSHQSLGLKPHSFPQGRMRQWLNRHVPKTT